MSFTTNTPNMGLTLPNVGQEPGPQFATDLNNALTTVDQHNHAASNGVPINSNGLAITQDLPLNSSNLTSVRTVRFNGTVATSGTDLACIYVNGVNLFYNDTSGNAIQISNSSATQSSLSASTGFFNTLRSSAIFVSDPSSAGHSYNLVVNQAGILAVKYDANTIAEFNNDGSFTSYGVSGIDAETGPISTSKFFVTDSTNPSQTGSYRLSNGNSIGWRNFLNSTDFTMQVDSTNNLIINTAIVAQNYLSATPSIAALGIIRLANSDTFNWRNAQGTGDVFLSVDSNNQFLYSSSYVTNKQTVVGSAQTASGSVTGASFIAFTNTISTGQFIAARTKNYKVYCSVPVTSQAIGADFQLRISGTTGSPTTVFSQEAYVTPANNGYIQMAHVYGIYSLTANVGYGFQLQGKNNSASTCLLRNDLVTNGSVLVAEEL